MTTNVLIRLPKNRPDKKSRAPALQSCPQKKAIVIKSFETTPRKPNSAKRKVAKVKLSNNKKTNVYLEGIGSNRLQPHSVVMVRGRGPRDTPGVRYHAIRGLQDFPVLSMRRNGRSKYAVKRPTKPTPKESLNVREQIEIKRSRYRFLRFKHCLQNRRIRTRF